MSIQEQMMHPLTQRRTTLALLGVIAISLFLLNREDAQQREEAENFRQATTFAKVGRWFWNIENNTLKWDHTMFLIYGIEGHDWTPNYIGFEERVDPRDRAMVNTRISAAIRNRSGYSAVFRTTGADGKLRYILAGAYVSPDGKYMTGVNVSLTEENIADLAKVLPR